MPTSPILIDRTLLDHASRQAADSPRRRRNINFHAADGDACHRLLNAIEPGSYVPPHRHLDPAKDETFVVLRGALGVALFDDAGEVVRTVKVGAGGTATGVDIAHGTWHTAVALEPDTVFLEAKAGPYVPFAAAEKAPWAPAENTPGATTYLGALKARMIDTFRNAGR
jgi:cupin fold WbuC family metalloprotein